MTHPLRALHQRKLEDGGSLSKLQKAWSRFFVSKLNFETSLKCHGGCVNCLQWSKAGNYLLSGSDDRKVCLWEPFTEKLLAAIPSQHQENIFSVKFVSRERQIVSGAGDGQVRHLDIASTSVLAAWHCHRYRVKRCCTIEDDDNIAISSSEDGTARQFDIREGHTCSSSGDGCANTLIKLDSESIKCINSNPTRTHLLCVGAGDEVARVYDRRMLTLSHSTCERTVPVQEFVPGHLLYRNTSQTDDHRYLTVPSITWCTFDPTGRNLLANMGGEQIYLYDMSGTTRIIEIPSAEKEEECSPPQAKRTPEPLDKKTEALKDHGNNLYKQQLFDRAVAVYTECLARCPDSVILLNNRAQALLKRNWKGDQYAALRDATAALLIDPENEKANFRQIQSYHAMEFNVLAQQKLNLFRTRYPGNEKSLKSFSEEIASALEERDPEPQHSTLRRPELIKSGIDYEQRFAGHCNCKTDIKEANFFGPSQEYILAGSDDKHIFVWDRTSGGILKIYRGDATLVNCVQPHPTLPFLATSGLERVVKLWSPGASQKDEDHQCAEEPELLDKIAADNQVLLDDMNPFPNISMIQNAMLGMLDPDGNPNSCNTS